MSKTTCALTFLIITIFINATGHTDAISISRFAFFEKINPIVVSLDNKSSIASAYLFIGIRPFNVTAVESLDPGFSVSYQMQDKDIFVIILRTRVAVNDNHEWFRIVVDGFQPGENPYKYGFGDIPVRTTVLFDLEGNSDIDIYPVDGGWQYYDDLINPVEIHVKYGADKTPVHHAIVLMELIGRAGLIGSSFTDTQGIAQQGMVEFERDPNIQPEQYLPDGNFSSLDYEPYTVRFIVVSAEGTSHRFEPYVTIRKLQEKVPGFSYEDVEIIIEQTSNIENWSIYN